MGAGVRPAPALGVRQRPEKYRAGKRFKYLYFWGHKQNLPTTEITKACLSQWFASSFKVDGVYYPTAEHYMMAAKAKLFKYWLKF